MENIANINWLINSIASCQYELSKIETKDEYESNCITHACTNLLRAISSLTKIIDSQIIRINDTKEEAK